MVRRFVSSALARVAAVVSLCAAVPAFAGSPGAHPGTGSDHKHKHAGATQAEAMEQALCAERRQGADCIVVLIDHLRTIQFGDEVATLLVGNPAIADVSLISTSQAAVTARSIGSTNMLFLDDAGNQIANYQVIVREPDLRRVTLRRGPGDTSLFQCAPRCERTLTQNDSLEAYNAVSGIVAQDNGLIDAALGRQDDSIQIDGGAVEAEAAE